MSLSLIFTFQVCLVVLSLGLLKLLYVLSSSFHSPSHLHLHTFTHLYPLNLRRSKDAFTDKINLHTVNFQHVIWPEQKADLNFELIAISHLNDLEVPSISADVPMFLQTWGVKQTSIKEQYWISAKSWLTENYIFLLPFFHYCLEVYDKIQFSVHSNVLC